MGWRFISPTYSIPWSGVCVPGVPFKFISPNHSIPWSGVCALGWSHPTDFPRG